MTLSRSSVFTWLSWYGFRQRVALKVVIVCNYVTYYLSGCRKICEKTNREAAVKERRSDQIHVAVTPSTKQALKEAARRRRVSLSELLRDAGLREAGKELRRGQREGGDGE